MVLVIGLNKKPVQSEEIVSLPADFQLAKFKTQQKKQAFAMAQQKASDPSSVAYAFFG